MTQQRTVKCGTCGQSWPAPAPSDKAHEHPSVRHAETTGHDDWRFA